MGRNYLWYRQGDATNAVLAAAGYNFRRLIQWLKLLLCQILVQLTAIASGDFEPEPLRGLRPQLINVKSAFFTDDSFSFVNLWAIGLRQAARCQPQEQSKLH